MRVIIALVVPMALIVAGCGTMLNLSNDREPYGGAKIDAGFALSAPTALVSGVGVFPRSLVLLFGVAGLVDLPLSLVGDTLTLPWTMSSEPEPHALDEGELESLESLPPSPSASPVRDRSSTE